VRPGAYPGVEQLKGVSLRYALALPANIKLSWLERLARDKHTNTLANYKNL